MFKAASQWVGLIALYVIAFQVNVYAASVLLLSHVAYEVADYLEFRKTMLQLRQARTEQLLGYKREDVGNC